MAQHSVTSHSPQHNLAFDQERRDLACAFRWTARLNMHEGVANHFSLAVNADGSHFLMNPDKVHFQTIRARDMILLDAHDQTTMEQPGAPDPTAWGLHGTIHRLCPHVRCAMHVHSTYATVLASLQDSTLPPIDQNTAIFFRRTVVDENYGGLAFEEEGARCADLLRNPAHSVLIMGNHGILVTGRTVAETFNRMYYFERAAETYIKALWTGQPLRLLSDEVAETVARQTEDYPQYESRHFDALRQILDGEEPEYAT